jgi:hypothetical protein
MNGGVSGSQTSVVQMLRVSQVWKHRRELLGARTHLAKYGMERRNASGAASQSFQILQSAEVKQHNDYTHYANYRPYGEGCRDVTLPVI